MSRRENHAFPPSDLGERDRVGSDGIEDIEGERGDRNEGGKLEEAGYQRKSQGDEGRYIVQVIV